MVSDKEKAPLKKMRNNVLILVLMEYGLGPEFSALHPDVYKDVLILVLMEYGLGQHVVDSYNFSISSLNPCFNGIWSRTKEIEMLVKSDSVLILVLMEYGLGQEH